MPLHEYVRSVMRLSVKAASPENRIHISLLSRTIDVLSDMQALFEGPNHPSCSSDTSMQVWFFFVSRGIRRANWGVIYWCQRPDATLLSTTTSAQTINFPTPGDTCILSPMQSKGRCTKISAKRRKMEARGRDRQPPFRQGTI